MSTNNMENKKRGTPSAFVGKRGEFFQAWQPVYANASRDKKLATFWPRFFAQYFINFHWSKPLTEEPEGALFINTAEDWVIPAEPQDGVSAEEKVAKDDFKKKAKAYFNHRRGAMGLPKNIWHGFIKQLRVPDHPPPRRVSDHQHYMHIKEFKTGVDDEYNKRHPNGDPRFMLAFKCDIAKELLEQEPDDVQKRMRAEAEEKHEKALEAYRKAAAGAPPVNEEDRQLARARLPEVITPLLSAIATFTGCNVTLLAANVETEPKLDVKVIGLNVGKTAGEQGKTLPEYDPPRYASMLESFSRFTYQTYASTLEKNPADPSSSAASSSAPPLNHSAADGADSLPRASTPAPTPPAASAPLLTTAGAVEIESPVRRKIAAMPEDQRAAYEVVLNGMNAMELSKEAEAARADERLQNEGGSEQRDEDEDEDGEEEEGSVHAPEPDPFAGMGVLSPLRRRTLAAAEVSGNLSFEVRKLRILSPYEMMRENNMANNFEKMKALGLDGGFSDIVEAGKKRGRKSAEKSRKRPRGDGNKDGEDNDDDEYDDDDDEEGEEGGKGKGKQVEIVPRAQRPQRSLPAPKRPGQPDWYTKGGRQLARGKDFGPLWETVTSLWASREEKHGFQSPVRAKGLSAKQRPSQIGWWINRARTGNPPISNVAEYGEEVVAWWHALNPSFRKNANSEVLAKTTGDWASMDFFGSNGYLSVLVALLWWRENLESESKEWAAVVEDVSWVFQQLNQDDESSGSTPAASASSTAESSGPTPAASASSTAESSGPTPAASASSTAESSGPTPAASASSTAESVVGLETTASGPAQSTLVTQPVLTAPFPPQQTLTTPAPSSTISLPGGVQKDASVPSIPATVTEVDADMPTPPASSPNTVPDEDTPMSDGLAPAAPSRRPLARPMWRNADGNISARSAASIAAAPSIIMQPAAPSSDIQMAAGSSAGDDGFAKKRAELEAKGYDMAEIDEIMEDLDADEGGDDDEYMDDWENVMKP
ncbi:hypothetical protein R3P38DRAFT_2797323 [Favolaschia claudopus]|uniref:Uncharacterized protein n=1 Tax=Favolaschia claudopus TaxID=2862362 RepID=A0AAW0A3E6_9AGAR